MQKFLKITLKQENNPDILVFVPVTACSFIRATVYDEVKYIDPQPDADGNPVEKVDPKSIVLEYPQMAQQPVPVALKHMKRIKQTKVEEIFELEKPQLALVPVFSQITDPEEIERYLKYFNDNVVG